MNNRQVAHVWAQQQGRDARGSSFFSDGPDIFSYGRHFLIARFVERKGKRAVLFTIRDYSMSTNRHKSYTYSAVSGLNLPIFTVRDPSNVSASGHVENRERYQTDIAASMASAARARKYVESHLTRAERLTVEANGYAAFFGLRWRLKAPDAGAEAMAKIREGVKKQAAAAAARTRKAEKELAAKYDKAVADFRAGLPLHDLRLAYTGMRNPSGITGALLRIRGDVVQTSRGAEVPLADAVRACRFIASKRGKAWERNGERCPVGHFQLARIDTDGNVTVGCHYIEWSEVVHLSMLLKAVEVA